MYSVDYSSDGGSRCWLMYFVKENKYSECLIILRNWVARQTAIIRNMAGKDKYENALEQFIFTVGCIQL